MAHPTIVVSDIVIDGSVITPSDLQYELEYAMSASNLIVTDKPSKISFTVQMGLACVSCSALITGENEEVVCQECQRPVCEKCVDTWHKADEEPEELPL